MKTELPCKIELRDGVNVALPREKFELKASHQPRLRPAGDSVEVVANSEKMESLIELYDQLARLGYELVYLQPASNSIQGIR